MKGVFNHRKEIPHIYLKPGEIWISREPVIVATVLGSCISATFFHPPSGFSGICHALQPRCPHPQQCSCGCALKFRYATCAISVITQQLAAYGLRPPDIEVKLFGGASLIGLHHPEAMTNSMGRLNTEAAMETIQGLGLRLQVINVGGNVGRKIIFDASTGIVLMKRLKGIPKMNLGRWPATAYGKNNAE